MFTHRNILKYTSTSPEGKTHNRIDHVLIGRRRHSSVLDIRYIRRADCDTDRYLVVAKRRDRLAVSKRAARKVDTERFNVKKLECSKLFDRRKQAKLQKLQDPSEVNEDNLIDVRREASRHFRNKKREYLRERINELQANSENIRELYRGINEFKKG
jgi:hypothetical protein